MAMSPRLRRLRSDAEGLQRLRTESSILDYSVPGIMHGGSPEVYVIMFHGRGVWSSPDDDKVYVRELHEVLIKLGASYPRQMPELTWRTPIFHPNISSNGSVCLGGYGTFWVPSLQLDELCTMLWDMIRYRNFDTESPYNRAAAAWAKSENGFNFPIDPRPLRNRVQPSERLPQQRVPQPQINMQSPPVIAPPVIAPPVIAPPVVASPVLPSPPPQPNIVFLDDSDGPSGASHGNNQTSADQDILFID